jgi:hypothetical protein
MVPSAMPKSRNSPVEKKIAKGYDSMRGTCHRSIHALNGSLEPVRPSFSGFFYPDFRGFCGSLTSLRIIALISLAKRFK